VLVSWLEAEREKKVKKKGTSGRGEKAREVGTVGDGPIREQAQGGKTQKNKGYGMKERRGKTGNAREVYGRAEEGEDRASRGLTTQRG